jgi:hypothetical protein
VDSGNNVGAFATGSFAPPKKPKPRCTVKKVKRGHKTVKICVARRHAQKKKHR